MIKLFSKGQLFGFSGGLLGTVLFGFIIWIIFLSPSEIFEIKNSSAGLLQKNLTEKDLNIKTETEIEAEAEPEPEPEEAPEVLIESFQDKIDNIEEKIDIVEQEISQLLVQETAENQEEVLAETVEIEEIEEIEEAKEPADDFIKLLISEVQVAGLADEKQEFIEIFNPNDFDVDLTGWSVKRKTATAENWSAYANSQLLEGRKIFAKGFFVIARTGYFTGASNVFTDTPITADNSFAIENSAGEIVDKLGFGGAVDPELLPAQNPEDGQSIGRKFLDSVTIQDTDNNSADFETGSITPFFQNSDGTYYASGGAGDYDHKDDSSGNQETDEENYTEQEPVVLQNILISEIQIDGETTKDDWIELYNPNDVDIFLGDYKGSYLRLVKRTRTGSSDSSIKSWRGDEIAKISAKGFYLWASSANKDYPLSVGADCSTSGSISSNNGVALKLGPAESEEIIDAVGWGNFDNILFEGVAALEPGKSQSIVRLDEIDTNNNSKDFIISNTPTPKLPNKIALPPVNDSGDYYLDLDSGDYF